MTASPTQRLASMLLDRDVTEFISDRRREGRSWRRISRDIYDATDKQIDVTYETVRGWYQNAGEGAA